VKKVEESINFTIKMNFPIGIFVNRSMKFHLFLIPFMARSRGTFVKSETSKDTKTYDSDIDIFESVLYNSKLLLIELLVLERLSEIIL